MKIKQNEIVFLLISSFVLVVAWIGFNLYNTSVKSSTAETGSVQVTPIDPTFDLKTLEELKTREKIEPLYQLQQTSRQISPTPTASTTARSKPTSIPAVTRSATPASSSAKL